MERTAKSPYLSKKSNRVAHGDGNRTGIPLSLLTKVTLSCDSTRSSIYDPRRITF